MRKLTATICCLVLSCALYAQNGWLPPVTFTSNTGVCDATPWTLVVYDDFNGNTLSGKWLTQLSYDSAWICRNGQNNPTREHLNFHETRYDKDAKYLYMDENVVVSNGTCKLLMKYKPGSTFTILDSNNCDYPVVTKEARLTTGMIRLPYQDMIMGGTKGYNSGRFQARLKIPGFNGAWPAFWMWPGRGGVSEIDITESFGGSGLGKHPVRQSTVAWWLNEHYNPYELPENVNIVNLYPHQGLINIVFRNYLDKSAWHTYTCEWDTTSISFQLDDETPRKIWKYYRSTKSGNQVITVNSGCNPFGTYSVTMGYPWNSKDANCDLRVSAGFGIDAEKIYKKKYGETAHDLGQMEVDFVKVWQRHPEQDNHTPLCADNTYPATPVISGPSEVCGQASYTISPAITGAWSTFNSNVLVVGSANASGCSVAKYAGTAFNQGWVAFSYGNGQDGCPVKTVTKRGLYCNKATNWNVMVPFVMNNNGEVRAHFMTDLYNVRDISGGTTPLITWNVSLNRGSDVYDRKTAETFTLHGQYASTPNLAFQPDGPYNLRWTINVTDASGTYSRSGERNSKTALYFQKEDTNTYYVNAHIDDQGYFDTLVSHGIAAQMVSEDEFNDTLFVNELIESTKANALEPYLIGVDNMRSMSKSALGAEALPDTETRVYPNPFKSVITIIAGPDFEDGKSITLNVYDLMGKTVKSGALSYQKGNVIQYDLTDLPAANYILELKQGSVTARVKITK